MSLIGVKFISSNELMWLYNVNKLHVNYFFPKGFSFFTIGKQLLGVGSWEQLRLLPVLVP
jgi:hypothetical protein